MHQLSEIEIAKSMLSMVSPIFKLNNIYPEPSCTIRNFVNGDSMCMFNQYDFSSVLQEDVIMKIGNLNETSHSEITSSSNLTQHIDSDLLFNEVKNEYKNLLLNSHTHDIPKELLNFNNFIPVIPEKYKVRIRAVHDPPFSIYHKENNSFTGVGPTILKMMEELSMSDCGRKFSYEIVKEDAFGRVIPCRGGKRGRGIRRGNGKASCKNWSGAVGNVGNNTADLAIGAITKTEARSEYVKFTAPFLKTSFAIMMHESKLLQKEAHSKFSEWAFVSPFDLKLWGWIFMALIIVTVAISIIDRISPYGYHGSYFQRDRLPQLPLLEESAMKLELRQKQEAEGSMSFGNSFYWAVTGLCWQSPEAVPRSPSGRIIAVVWYLCGVIFITSYTANIVAFLGYRHHKDQKIETFQRLEQNLDDYYIGYIKHSVVDGFLEQYYPKIINTGRAKGFINFNQLYDDVLSRDDKPYAIIWEADSLDRQILDLNRNSSFGRFYIPEKSRIGRNEFCFIVQHNSKIGQAFIRWMRILSSGNSFHKIPGLHIELDKNLAIRRGNLENENDASSSIYSSESLTYYHLAGVFRILSIVPIICLLILSLEWTTACINDIDKTDPNKPQSILEAFEIRISRLGIQLLSQEKSFGYWLFKLMPGKISLLEFKCQMVLKRAIQNKISRRKFVLEKQNKKQNQQKVYNILKAQDCPSNTSLVGRSINVRRSSQHKIRTSNVGGIGHDSCNLSPSRLKVEQYNSNSNLLGGFGCDDWNPVTG